MPRVRVPQDYEAKKKAIIDAAAKLFARVGYLNTNMSGIAAKCGASKSMLYHYFPKKEDLLFEMMKEHLEDIMNSYKELERTFSDDPVENFNRIVADYVQRSEKSRDRHLVVMNDVRFLPKQLRKKIVDMERSALEIVADTLKRVNPNLDDKLYKPYALFIFGIINWTDVWYSSKGSMSREELAARISRLSLYGFFCESCDGKRSGSQCPKEMTSPTTKASSGTE